MKFILITQLTSHAPSINNYNNPITMSKRWVNAVWTAHLLASLESNSHLTLCDVIKTKEFVNGLQVGLFEWLSKLMFNYWQTMFPPVLSCSMTLTHCFYLISILHTWNKKWISWKINQLSFLLEVGKDEKFFQSILVLRF